MNFSQPWNETRGEYCNLLCIFTLSERVAITCSLGVVFLVSVIGNSLILYVTVKNAQMLSTTVLLIVNLSVADLLMSFFCVPWIVIDYYLLANWIFGNTLCKIVTFTQSVSITVSMLTICAISIQKLIVVYMPLSHRKWMAYLQLVMVSVWLFSVGTSIVHLLYRQEIDMISGEKYCGDSWPNAIHEKVYSMTHSIIVFFVPSVIMLCTSIFIPHKLSKQDQILRSDTRRPSLAQTKAMKRRRRAASMLRMVSFCCIFCWTPYHVLIMLFLSQVKMDIRAVNISYPICIGLLFLCCALHPVLFGFMTGKYRKAFLISFRTMSPPPFSSVRSRDKSSAFPRLFNFTATKNCDEVKAKDQEVPDDEGVCA